MYQTPLTYYLDPAQYEFNMPVVATLDGIEVDEHLFVAVYNGMELLGVGQGNRYDGLDRGLFFINLMSNKEKLFDLRIELFDAQTGSYFDVSDKIDFNRLGAKGSVEEPMLLRVPEYESGLETATFALHSAIPNPFSEQVKIVLDVPYETEVILEVYDALGRRVAELNNGNLPEGRHEVLWNSREASTGLYIVRMKAGGVSEDLRIVKK
jgi:hypothetical protein